MDRCGNRVALNAIFHGIGSSSSAPHLPCPPATGKVSPARKYLSEATSVALSGRGVPLGPLKEPYERGSEGKSRC
ncbi:hypothetical protein DICSQDRAFT_138643 [Dichomitus squalens LYAD-421 SS1]|uniref:Uncharacterized protein n=1 Tax=Dichomitus squalens (strain LYAD-421) TaxID=732165 RepID=R7STE7_DICSQ|nr:uncharacterized protein DICSQDRAFT_138643 [Dichomitus squalens LYAD-421 SS1]EJF59341.1 hypothetical protein DICSQDRAFT_138643 [Dichomitus squalens LYAD-421 SS1]